MRRLSFGGHRLMGEAGIEKKRKREMTGAADGQFDFLDRRWRWLLVACWLAVAGFMLEQRLGAIRLFALGDTDDNMRIMQVRALLHGQGWYDLAQHRLAGAHIHWSRLPDPPLAAPKRRIP